MKGSPKKVLNGKFHNTRPVGKQRIRWEDVVHITDPRNKGMEKTSRRQRRMERLLREARVQKGL